MPISLAIFDAFGTLLKIGEGTHPYRKILKLGIEQGRRPNNRDAETLLTMSMDLRQAASYFGIKVEASLMRQFESDLEKELAGIEAYSDGVAAVEVLQGAGVKVAVCSNLARPYASAIERLYPRLDSYVYSFVVGAIKPSADIYREALKSVAAAPGDAWMIGDSKRCDCDGPTTFGIQGFFLDRKGESGFTSLEAFAEALLFARTERVYQ
ncbi:HAD family hydrolase [Pseudomonas lurida]|uniref:HAD family hydrolase n=1 Tax=Pseudomonas lurida TaxID=244566 RepID=UPI0016481E5F|nr:HAD family hydrolase [Pseudomonas lurida]MBC3245026.1 HAD family hydrolase [Pseudomonas lurida]